MHAFPMEGVSEAHEASFLMFQRDSIPSWMIVDGLKDQVEGNFALKCKESG